MRVLMVSKACLVGAYQTKLTAIGQAADVELTVVVPPRWEDPAGPLELERAHLDGYELRVSPIRFNGHFHIHYYPELPRLLRELRPDILHMDEEPYNLATWLALRAARRLDIRSLFFSWQNLNNRYPPPFSWLERQVLDWADYGLMGNRAAVEVWQAKGYDGPYAVIPQFGVSPDIFQPAPGPRPDGPLRIGCLNRRLVAEKGVDILLEAVADLPFPWELRIAGEGEARAAVAGADGARLDEAGRDDLLDPGTQPWRLKRRRWALPTGSRLAVRFPRWRCRPSWPSWMCWCCPRGRDRTGKSSLGGC